jgi:two-component system, OmpR family, alkaline phosphatase synthesis response regulator PhoP
VKIGIVEDDEKLSALLKLVVAELTSDIDVYDNGWKALDGIAANTYDAVVLDVMLPGLNGIEICKQLRAKNNNVPILMLTAKSEEDDKVLGLETGADDYLTKPFSNKELLARIKSLLRRSDKVTTAEQKNTASITIGELTINPAERTLHKLNKEIELTSKEFDLLYLFMQNAGRNYTRIDLLERVWGENFDGLEHTINSNINRIRIKIESDPANPNYLLTIWGVGYKFNKNPQQS